MRREDERQKRGKEDFAALHAEYRNSVGVYREVDSRKIKHSRSKTATSVQL